MTASRERRGLWWILVVVTVVGYVVAMPTAGSLQNASLIVPMAGYFVVGALVTRRRPGNPIGWVFLVTAATSGILGAANLFYTRAFESLVADPPASGVPLSLGAVTVAATWISTWLWFVLLYLMTFLTFLLYPDGLPSRRWRPLLWSGGTGLVAITLLAMLTPTLEFRGGAEGGPSFVMPNPVSPSVIRELPDQTLSRIEGAFTVLALVCLVLSVVSLFVRFRGATVVERAQLRWFALAATALLLSLPIQDRLPGGSDGTAANLLFTGTATFVPVACGLAILRYRLYDIDRIISRTTSYAIVTACVVGVYALVVASASVLLPEGVPSWVIAGATLVAAALVRPLLSRVQRVVDRRFNRERIDAQRAIEAFGAGLVDELDPQVATRELLAVTCRAWAPASLSLWSGER